MSVTRYNFEVASQFKITDQIVYVEARPSKNGKHVRYSDYASLFARHNALVEAVKKEHLAFDALDDAGFQLGAVGMPIWTDHAAARAEVDRLIADCKGEE